MALCPAICQSSYASSTAISGHCHSESAYWTICLAVAPGTPRHEVVGSTGDQASLSVWITENIIHSSSTMGGSREVSLVSQHIIDSSGSISWWKEESLCRISVLTLMISDDDQNTMEKETSGRALNSIENSAFMKTSTCHFQFSNHIIPRKRKVLYSKFNCLTLTKRKRVSVPTRCHFEPQFYQALTPHSCLIPTIRSGIHLVVEGVD